MKIFNKQGGYIIILLTLLFTSISLIMIMGGSIPILAHYSAINGFAYSTKALAVAESATEDAIYRLKSGKTLPSSVTLSLPSGSATITRSTVNNETLTINGEENNFQRNIRVDMSTGAGIDFNYGLQSGNGGVTLSGGSTINGNIYSNGSIDAINSTITGSAIAADSASLSADQVNDSPTTPLDSIIFGDTSSATRDFAQSFQISNNSPINKIQLYLKKASSASNATVLLNTDNNGNPGSITIDSATLSSGQVTSNYGWIDVVFPSSPSLSPNTTYWIIIQTGSQGSTKSYTLAANNSYSLGISKIGKYGGTFTNSDKDGYFRIYTGGISSYIGGAGYVGGVVIGSNGVGDAWASTVIGASAQGHIYCTNITASLHNNKSCDTSKGSPPPQPMPFSEANIQSWKDSTISHVFNGNKTIGWAGDSLGPLKINGDLLINGGGTLTLNGPLWVTGNVTVTSGGKIQLAANYDKNSEVIVSDGIISISGGGSVSSDSPNSFLFMVSTSKCPNDINCSGGSGTSAININGGAGAIAANAQNGNVALSGGASINAAVGNSITLTGGSTVTYNSGLASPYFQTGPSGGYNIIDWYEN